MSSARLGVLVAVLAGSALLVVGALAAPTARPSLSISIIGPSKGVVAGSRIQYVLVMKNIGNVSIGQVRLSLIPAVDVAASSVPYKRTFRPIYKTYSVYWSPQHFRPGAKYTVHLVLRFPVLPGGGEGTVFSADAHGTAPYVFKYAEKPVYFKQPG